MDSLRTRLERIFEALERLSGLYVTVHDPAGFFCDASAKSILHEKRMFHDIPFCRTRREHCRENDWVKGNAAAAKAGRPLLWRCWRGRPCQILLPVMWQGRHLGTVFLGPFRIAGEALGCKEEESLPVFDLATFERDSELYSVIADGLARQAVSSLGLGVKSERWERIFGFVVNSQARGVGIKDLAKELNLSPSRASHVVRECFGMPFEKVLMEHKLERAAALLENSDLTLAQIASALGFCDLYYLSKLFKRKTGVPPGKFRAMSRMKSKDRV